MKPENIVEMHQETWLIYKSIKTGTEVRLPVSYTHLIVATFNEGFFKASAAAVAAPA